MTKNFCFTMIVAAFLSHSTIVMATEIIAESDTAVVFGDLDCKITEHTFNKTGIYADDFDYLHGYGQVKFSCVDRRGRIHAFEDAETVFFPTAIFDWATQTWMIGQRTLAVRGEFGKVTLAEGLKVTVNPYQDETHIAFSLIIGDVDGL